MVYVLNCRACPIMPCSEGKARRLLKEGKAKVISIDPFTIQLKNCYGTATQPTSFAIDPGYETVGFSAITSKKELLSGELQLLSGISERIKEKRMYRTQRRSSLRYRKPRFDNRKKARGWLAPSILHKLETHIRLVKKIKTILPITSIVVEVANFDIKKIKNPQIEGKEYQDGEQKGYWNLREYVLHRDKHLCQNPGCKNKAKQKILQVHHVAYWKKDRNPVFR